MTETVTSRTWLNLLGASVFLGGGGVPWVVVSPMWAQTASIVFMLLGAGLLYRWLIPAAGVFTADASGITWSIAGKTLARLDWADLRSVRQNSEDGQFRLGTGANVATRIPGEFLRTPALQAEFCAVLATFRPDLAVEQD